jgi:hypothetical protein
MNSRTIEREEIVIIVMNIVQKCYNSCFLTCLTHYNPSNKIEYAW